MVRSYDPIEDQLALKSLFEQVQKGATPFLNSWTFAQLTSGLKRYRLRVFSGPGDSLLGFLLALPVEDGVELLLMGRSPETAKRGIGRLLMEDLKSQLLPGQSIFLEVDASNAKALKFYNSQGFKVVGSRPNYYGKGRHAQLMALPIENT